MNGHDDEARDPHLREALRHAPDADVQAPPALGDFILKEARAKVRDPSAVVAPPAPSTARRLWDWLTRPAVTTGFAGVMAATLVGLMWWDQPMDEALPRHPAPAAAPAAENAVTALPPAPVVASAPTPNDTATTAPKPARKKAADAPRNAPDSAGAGATAELTRSAPRATPAPVTIAPPAAPEPAASLAFADIAAASALAKARLKEEEQKRERSSMAPAEAQSRRAAAKAQVNEWRLQGEAAAFISVASVRSEIAVEPARWTWQRDDSAPQPLNDALHAWMAQLDAAAGTRWQPANATARHRLGEVSLLLDGRIQHSIELTDSGVLWRRSMGDRQFATLPSTSLKALEASLP